MKEKVMQGKPYAGNPHVRFDEGAGAPRHSGRPALLYKTRQILASTITQGDDSNQGHYTDHDYDHFSYSNREHQYIHGVERVDAPAKYYSGDFKKYGERMSDHVPVTMLFDVGTTNPEHVASGVSTMEEQR